MKRFLPRFLCVVAALGGFDAGANAEEQALPPTASGSVDFARDIEPIFQNACLRCHGPLKAKSHFRLDNRVSALAGGDKNTNDIVAGDSSASLLIRYVAHGVEDMEMPPLGKGDALTSAQVGLLRAWIDQGANWGASSQTNSTAVTVEPTIGGFSVHGNNAKFRELEGAREGFAGGIEKFSLTQKIGPDATFTMDGYLLVPQQDYKLSLGLDKTEVGFVHAGFEQWRKYYAPDGGYNPSVTPSQFQPPGDLYVNNGDAWVDFGLTLPHWPQMVLGYEYQYQNGTEATLDWGPAHGRDIFPATQGLNELTHIVKFDLTNDVAGWHVENQARVEFYSEKNEGSEFGVLGAAVAPGEFINTRDDYHHTQGMETLMFEKPLYDWWLLSGGFYYSRLEGSDYFNQTTAVPAFGVNSALSSQQITLSRESEMFDAASSFVPLDYLTFSIASQNEWSRQDGFGASVPDLDLLVNTPASSSVNEFKASQLADFRFTKIPFTVISGSAQIAEDRVSEYQDQDPSVFARDTDADNLHYNAQFGLATSPWRSLEFSANVRRDDSRTDYNHLLDIESSIPGPSNGYPAFILNREIRSDLFETKLVWRAATWLKTTLTYQLNSTRYTSKTDPAFSLGLGESVSPGGAIVDGTYDQQIYGFAATVTPMRRLYFTGAFTYGFSHAFTADNGDPSVQPYRGDIYTFSGSATYALDPKSTLQAAYNFSTADYNENNAATGVPLGLNYTRHDLIFSVTRKFNARFAGSLRYAFSKYSEPSGGNVNNYVAQGFFGFVTYKLD
jgi:mono/diheme cytochrome c family protein/predicted HicB family RNase H-like nuclease